MKAIIPFVAVIFIKVLGATLRLRHVRASNIVETPRYILAFWHAHLAMMLHCRYRKPIAVMTSRSKDGEYMSRVLNRFGVETARGSSSRGGGEALRELLRKVRAGSNIVFTPDGPKGPPRVAKEGVIYSAQASGLPIIPIAFAAERSKLLRTWDRMIIPKPFTRAFFLYGEPIAIPRGADVEEWRERVERAMNDLVDEADRNFDQLWRSGER